MKVLLANVVASVLLAALLAASGCSSAPLSLVEGVPQTRNDSTLYPVRVVSVDGSIQFNAAGDPVRLSPGARWMVLEAESGDSARRHVQKPYVFKVEPCTRYYLAAKRSSPMDADWSLVVDVKETVAGCSPAEELKKAGLSATSGASVPK